MKSHQSALAAIARKCAAGDFAGATHDANALLASAHQPAQQAPAHYWLGVIAHRERRHAEAVAHYQTALAFDKRNAQLLFQLGVVHGHLGDEALAEKYYREALRIEPRLAPAHYNLGTLLLARGDNTAARRAFEAAITHQPYFIQAHNNLGNALLAEGDRAGAEKCYQAAIRIEPNFAQALHGLGLLRAHEQEHRAACVLFERATAAAPHFDMAWLDLADARYATGDQAGAIRCLDQILARAPDHVSARFKRAQFAGNETPSRAPREVLERLYASMAPTFDMHLTGRLDYRLPALLRDTLTPWLASLAHKPDVLDLGCGTGLFGLEIRPHCAQLIGVDLSAAMLEKAKGRGVYDALHCAELGDYLAQAHRTFQLISATDVLIYLGELDTLFGKIATQLAAGGLFAGSIESPADLHAGFRLLPTGRFAHSMAYVTDCAKSAGLAVAQKIPTVIRLEKAVPINGFLFLLKRVD